MSDGELHLQPPSDLPTLHGVKTGNADGKNPIKPSMDSCYTNHHFAFNPKTAKPRLEPMGRRKIAEQMAMRETRGALGFRFLYAKIAKTRKGPDPRRAPRWDLGSDLRVCLGAEICMI
jgi:hypothetical protein